MKYILIPYIALGLVLSLAVGVEWHCDGQEMFPEFYGSPIIFKRRSLASSLTYYYSISGLMINIAIWSLVIVLLRALVLRAVQMMGNNKNVVKTYRVIVGVLILWTTLNVVIDCITVGRGFGQGVNYWYMDIDKEAMEWGVECKGKWSVFGK